jgi:uncharacterized protein
MRLWLALAGVAAATAAIPGEAPAQGYPELSAARRAGQVGERFDGYLGYAATPPATVQRQVAAINIRRRSLYVDFARRHRVTLQEAGIATGCELLRMVGVGEVYMLQDGVWRRRMPGQSAPSPGYCG